MEELDEELVEEELECDFRPVRVSQIDILLTRIAV